MTGRQLLGGTWNMERDRKVGAAVGSLVALMSSKQLDFLLIQECSGYLAALRKVDGLKVISFDSDRGRSESAIVLRAELEHDTAFQRRATRSGWITVRGTRTSPKYLTTVKVDGWLRIVSGHTAPSVRWRGGRVLGPVRRVTSMRQFARSVVRFARNHKGPLLIAGDWNATPEARGRWSPTWIGRKAGMHIAAPSKGTHGNRVIDFALVRDCGAQATREKTRGSDHHVVVFRVRP